MTWTIIVAAVITISMLGVGRALTNVGPWYRNLRKPSWNPPDWLFGPAWTLILGLAAWAGVLGWSRAMTTGQHVLVAVLFGANIVLHTLWSPLFFNLQRPDWALMEVAFLWLSILALILVLGLMSAVAALLMVPYLLWVGFAAYLNLTIVRLNRPFGSPSRRAAQ